jgi:hypothetical protein
MSSANPSSRRLISTEALLPRVAALVRIAATSTS